MKTSFLKLSVTCLILFNSFVSSAPAANDQEWYGQLYQKSIASIKASFLPNGGVIASPSKQNPDYFYVWVRDASLTVDAIAQVYAETGDKEIAALIEKYAVFSKDIQATPNPSNSPGEPKWNVDKTPFTGPWARPQNDGPASRAFALTRYAKACVSQGCNINSLYSPDTAAGSPIKNDLEFVAHHWKEQSNDIWEEVLGDHFYTKLVQRRSLLDGAELAKNLKDDKAAEFYLQQIGPIEQSILSFWDSNRKFFVVTKDRTGGVDYKNSGIDTQVLLASLHADRGDGFVSPSSDKILATVFAAVQSFKPIYKINQGNTELGAAIGRYPEDKYNGNGFGEGNPWMLTTAAIAEIHYKTKIDWAKEGKFQVTEFNVEFLNDLAKGKAKYQAGTTVSKGEPLFSDTLNALQVAGDSYMARIRLHTGDSFNLFEQWNRDTGFQQGAYDLTWSYVGFVTAYRAQQQAIKIV